MKSKTKINVLNLMLDSIDLYTKELKVKAIEETAKK